jgi:hypothetical protein
LLMKWFSGQLIGGMHLGTGRRSFAVGELK